eukprot:4561144-Prymnesium_polylepis.1
MASGRRCSGGGAVRLARRVDAWSWAHGATPGGGLTVRGFTARVCYRVQVIPRFRSRGRSA